MTTHIEFLRIDGGPVIQLLQERHKPRERFSEAVCCLTSCIALAALILLGLAVYYG
jgi:hypothetical protein